MHSFPAAFPFRVSEEAPQHLGIQIALALEIAIESAVRQARAGHDLLERNALRAIPVKQLACTVDDVLLDCRAVTSRIGHENSLISCAPKYASKDSAGKYYLEHILERCSYAGEGSEA